MRYAPIAAPQWARHYQRGDYHMVIAPWVLDAAGIGQYYAMAARASDVWVLMDNGAWEGHNLSLDEIIRAGTLIRADEVVLPDVLHDGKATLKASLKGFHALREEPWPGLKMVMFVPQGRTADVWRRCRDAWVNMWEVENYDSQIALSIGINSPRGEGFDRKRSDLIIETVALGYDVHLLGIPDLQQFVHIELPLAKSYGVRGVDSSLPFALGSQGRLLAPNSEKIPLGKPDQYEKISARNRRLIHLNIAIMRQWVASGTHSWYVPIDLVRQVALGTSLNAGDERAIYGDLIYALKCVGAPAGGYAVDKQTVLPVLMAPEDIKERMEGKRYVEVRYAM